VAQGKTSGFDALVIDPVTFSLPDGAPDKIRAAVSSADSHWKGRFVEQPGPSVNAKGTGTGWCGLNGRGADLESRSRPARVTQPAGAGRVELRKRDCRPVCWNPKRTIRWRQRASAWVLERRQAQVAETGT